MGVYRHIGLCSHSCAPSCDIIEAISMFKERWHGHPQSLLLRTVRDLHAGEEVSISYMSRAILQSSRASRRSLIKQMRGFACRCPKCKRILIRRWHEHTWKGARRSKKTRKVWEAS